MLRELDLIAKNISESCIAVLALEWRGSVKHLVDQDTQRPPVDRASMTTAFDHLRSDVLFRAHERVGPKIGDAGFGIDGGERGGRVPASCRDHCRGTARPRLLGKVKVRQHDMARLVQKDVLRLQITVNKAH